jgi:hypothetical protein
MALLTEIMEAFTQSHPNPKSRKPSTKAIPTLLGSTPREQSNQNPFHKGQITW